MNKQVSLVSTPELIEHMKKHYERFDFKDNLKNIIFKAKKNGVTITAYRTGTVMFQGHNSEKEVQEWEMKQKELEIPTAGKPKEPTTAQSEKTNASSLLPNFSNLSVLGSDEVGNGSYFGPLVVCATYVDKTRMKELIELSVKDSKKMADSKIMEIAKKLKHDLKIPYQISTFTPEQYNEYIKKPENNAISAKVHLHNKAISLLLTKLKNLNPPITPEAILIDEFVSKKNYINYLTKEKDPIQDNVYFATQGESHHLAVAAASIISRAKFVETLEKYSEELGVTIPSGAGEKATEVGTAIFQKGGNQQLAKYVKIHFKNTKDVQQKSNSTKKNMQDIQQKRTPKKERTTTTNEKTKTRDR